MDFTSEIEGALENRLEGLDQLDRVVADMDGTNGAMVAKLEGGRCFLIAYREVTADVAGFEGLHWREIPNLLAFIEGRG